MSLLETADEYKIIKFLKGKDFISLLNCLFGFYAIYFAIRGVFLYSAILLVLAFVADVLDGKVARMLSQSNEFGKRMDMADLVSFGAAPAIFILIYYQPNVLIPNILLHLAAIFLISAALFRLARFQSKSSNISGFIGVPSTTNGIIYPLLYFLNIGQYPAIVITFLMSFLMLSAIIIPVNK